MVQVANDIASINGLLCVHHSAAMLHDARRLLNAKDSKVRRESCGFRTVRLRHPSAL
jgi:hypothetical protein